MNNDKHSGIATTFMIIMFHDLNTIHNITLFVKLHLIKTQSCDLDVVMMCMGIG